MNVSATIYIERNGIEDIPVAVEGVFTRGSKGFKNHPMDRFAEPDEPDEVEITSAVIERSVYENDGHEAWVRFIEGESIDLTDAETDRAEEALLEAVADERESAEESRAEVAAERRRERMDE